MLDGYPKAWTLGQMLERGWYGSYSDHWRRLCEIIVDGQRLYEAHPRVRKPSPHETRYSKKFGEVMLAANALARLPATSISITTRERPDLAVTIDDLHVGLEVAEIHPHAHAVNGIADLNIALGDTIDALGLQPECALIHISPRAGRRGNIAIPKRERSKLLTATIRWLKSGDYRSTVAQRKSELRYDWAGADLGFMVHIGYAPYWPKGFVQVGQGAWGFNPEAMIGPALQMLSRKCALGLTYDRSQPLWLVLGITDQTGLYTASLQALAQQALSTGCYQRVILHDGSTYVTQTAA